MSDNNPPTKQTSLDKLIQNMDDMQLTRQPLEPHAMSEASDPNTLTYATMLVMLLTNQTMSEAQTRLLKLLLASMGMDIDLQPIYANMANVDKAFIQEFCEMCDSEGVAVSFLMDALTLCRLDKPLSEPQRKTLSELVNLFGLDATTLADVLHLSNTVLGETLDIDKDTDDDTIRMLSQLRLDFDYDKLKPWHEFGYRPITEESQLTDGINGGKWLIGTDLRLSSDFEIKDAIVLFNTHGLIKVEIKNESWGEIEYKFNLLGSTLIKAKLELTSNIGNTEFHNSFFVEPNISCNIPKILFEKCFFTGIGSSSEANEYLRVSNFSNFEMTNCEIKNSHNTGLDIKDSNYSDPNIKISNCTFTNCGNKYLEKGGAINISNRVKYNFIVKKSIFIDNLSKHGADINLEKSNPSFSKIEICSNSFLLSEQLEDENYSIYVPKNENSSIDELNINYCNFENKDLFINFYEGSWGDIKKYYMYSNSEFKNSTIYTNYQNEKSIAYKCVFKNKDKPNVLQSKDKG